MDNRISDILDYIEETLSQNHSVGQLAEKACLSPSQFARLFKKETAFSPLKFIEQMKLKKAYLDLLNSNIRIYQLAEDLGYRDYETFSRAFKKFYLLSPDDLRAVINTIQKSLKNVSANEILLKAFKDETSDSELLQYLAELTKEKNISRADLEIVKVFKIVPKSTTARESQQLIKNKYELKDDKKIWQMLVDHHKVKEK